jgi:hypothetical protein
MSSPEDGFIPSELKNEVDAAMEQAKATPTRVMKFKEVKAVIDAVPVKSRFLLKPGRIDDLEKFKKLFYAGLTHAEIADVFGVTRELVTIRANKLGLTRINLSTQDFKVRMESEMLDRMQKILLAMTPEKVDKSSLSQLIMAFGILFDKVRLNRGESTQNVASLNLHKIDPKAIDSIKEIIARETEKKLRETRKEYVREVEA